MKPNPILLGVAAGALLSGVAMADDPGLGEVKFRFDSAELPASVSDSLGAIVTYAEQHPESRVVLDAHCDPIGTSPYNVKLALRRAESVRQQLTTMGVPAEQVVIAAYGEEGQHRAHYADDRRVTLWPTRDPLASVIDHTFTGQGVAVLWDQPLTVSQIQAPPDPVATR